MNNESWVGNSGLTILGANQILFQTIIKPLYKNNPLMETFRILLYHLPAITGMHANYKNR